MSKYIKREDAIEKYRLLIKDYIATESTLIWESAGDCKSAEEQMYREVEEWLKDFESLPTIEVVRCEDCRLATYTVKNGKTNEIFYACPYSSIHNEGKSFCSYGERIEE